MTMRCVLTVLFLLGGTPADADKALPGAETYRNGAGLVAHLGSLEGPALPPGRLTCAGCHGVDGGGGTEGRAPAVRWPVLAAPTDDRPAYDAQALARLLAQGVTPSGRQIGAVMPRYDVPPDRLAALVAHLQALGQAETQGIGPTTIAVTLPDAPAERAAALASIAAFNAEGGAYGRNVMPGAPAFLDLGMVARDLAPRLRQAEQDRLAMLLREDDALHPLPDALPAPSETLRLAATLDAAGPRLPAILARPGTRITLVGPAAASLDWALAAGQDASAAHVHAAVALALTLLRDEGRQPQRSRLLDRIKDADLSGAVEVYPETP